MSFLDEIDSIVVDGSNNNKNTIPNNNVGNSFLDEIDAIQVGNKENFHNKFMETISDNNALSTSIAPQTPQEPIAQTKQPDVAPTSTPFINTTINEYGQQQEGGYSTPQPYDVGADINKVGKIAKVAVKSSPYQIAKGISGILQATEENAPKPFTESIEQIGQLYNKDFKLNYGETAATYWDKKIQDVNKGLDIDPDSPLHYVKGALDSLALNVPFIMAGALTGNPSLALTGMSAQSGGSQYVDLRKKGIDPETAGYAGMGYAVMEGLGESLSIGNLLSNKAFIKKAFEQLALEPTGEMITELGQFLIDKKVLPKETKWSYLSKRLSDAAIISLVSSGFQTAAIHPVVKAISLGNKPTKQDIAQLATDVEEQIKLNPPKQSDIQTETQQETTNAQQPIQTQAQTQETPLNQPETNQEPIPQEQHTDNIEPNPEETPPPEETSFLKEIDKAFEEFQSTNNNNVEQPVNPLVKQENINQQDFINKQELEKKKQKEKEKDKRAEKKYINILKNWAEKRAQTQAGQNILDDIEEEDRTVHDVSNKFWKETYFKLNEPTQKRFMSLTKQFFGDDENITSEQMAEELSKELPKEIEHLEGTERGFVALMEEANIREFAKEQVKNKNPRIDSKIKKQKAADTTIIVEPIKEPIKPETTQPEPKQPKSQGIIIHNTIKPEKIKQIAKEDNVNEKEVERITSEENLDKKFKEERKRTEEFAKKSGLGIKGLEIVSPRDVIFAPDTYQFKDNTDSKGVRDRITSEEYDNLAAGLIAIHERLDGKRYVVSGHHRTEFERRMGIEARPAIIYKESDGFTVKDVVAIGAMANIREGGGNLYDWANFIRNSSLEFKPENYPASGKQAVTIANGATENTYIKFKNKKLTPKMAEVISREAPNDVKAQDAILRYIEANPKVSADEILQRMKTIKMLKSQGIELGGEKQISMFGNEETFTRMITKISNLANKKIKDINEKIIGVKAFLSKDKRIKSGREFGIEIKNVADARNKLEKYQNELNRWKNWETDTALRNQLLSETGLNKNKLNESIVGESKEEPPKVSEQQADLFQVNKVEDIDNITEDKKINRERIQEVFKGQKVITNTDGSFTVELKNGFKIDINEVGDIIPSIKLKSDEYVAGRWNLLDNKGVISLSKMSDDTTLPHETFHAAMDIVLSPREKKAVIKKYGDEETAADAYAEMKPRQVKGVFAKIMNFFRKLRNSLFPTAEGVFEKVKSGKAWGNNATRRTSQRYQIKKKPTLRNQIDKNLGVNKRKSSESQIEEKKRRIEMLLHEPATLIKGIKQGRKEGYKKGVKDTKRDLTLALNRKKRDKAEVKKYLKEYASKVMPKGTISTVYALIERANTPRGVDSIVKKIDKMAEKILHKKAVVKLKKLIKKTKKFNLRTEFKTILDGLLENISGTKMSKKKMDSVQKSLEYFENNKELEIPEQVMKQLNYATKIAVSDLSLEEVQDLTNNILTIKQQSDLKDKLINMGKQRDYIQDKNTSLDEIGDIPNNAVTPIKNFFQKWMFKAQLNPITIISSISGSDKGTLANYFWHNFKYGLNKVREYKQDFRDFIKENLKDKDIRNMSEMFNPKKDRKTGKHEGVNYKTYRLSSGRTIDLSSGEVISLYLHSLNDDNLRHIVSKDTTEERPGIYLTRNETVKYKISSEDVLNIVNEMTDKEMEIATIAYEYFNDFEKKRVNEVSREIIGRDVATAEDYFPINVTKLERSKNLIGGKELNKGISELLEFTLEGMGVFKSRVKSKKGILLKDVFQVMEESKTKMSKFVGLVSPLRSAKTLLTDTDIAKAIIQKYGKKTYEYLELYLKELEGSVINEQSEADKLISEWKNNLVVGVLSLSIPTFFKQPVSYLNVLDEMDLNHWTKGIVNKMPTVEHMSKYSPYIRERAEGRINRDVNEAIEAGETRRTWLNETDNASKLMKGISAFDMLAIRKIWSAVDSEITDNTNLTGDEKEQAIADRTEEIISKTQPSFDPTDLTEISRSRTSVARLITAFQTVGQMQYNMIMRRYALYKKNPSKETFSKMIQTGIITGVISAFTLAAIDSIGKGLYNVAAGKKPEPEQNSILEKGFRNMFLNVLHGKEIYRMVRGLLEGKGGNVFTTPFETIVGREVKKGSTGATDFLVGINKFIGSLYTDNPRTRDKSVDKMMGGIDKMISVIVKGKYGLPYDKAKQYFYNIPKNRLK